MSQAVFVFKVALSGRKRIWRRIAARGSQTLDDLHKAVFAAFDRDDPHLYSFYFPKPGARGRDRTRGAVEYACPFACEDPDLFAGRPVRNAGKTKLSMLGLTSGQVLLYLFDFGDEWLHDITVEQIDAKPEKGDYPRVLEKHGESPPQYPDLDEE